MKQYLFSVHGSDDDQAPPADEIQQMFKAVEAFNAEVMAEGKWVFGGGLEAADTATVVRVDNGDVVTTDGPFIESKEHLGGFWILECVDLDEALALAKRASTACASPVEVRPFQDEPES